MKIRYQTFNIYFLCFLLGPLVLSQDLLQAGPTNSAASPKASEAKQDSTGAAKKKKKKPMSTLRVHLETPKDGTGRTAEISVLRSSPMVLTIDKEPILDQSRLIDARVVEGLGGAEIELQFDSQGRTLLENYTAANRGRRLAIGSDFDKQRRWLAAPKIARLLSDGMLRFTPDASPEEIKVLVQGLINMAEIKKKKDKF